MRDGLKAAVATAARKVEAARGAQGVGRGLSGPSIEGQFCRAVHLCRALGDRKIEKKSK